MEHTYEERLKAIEKNIQEAQIELTLNQKQLETLKQQRQELTDKCQQEFGCSITELDDLISEKEEELKNKISMLESNMKKINDE